MGDPKEAPGLKNKKKNQNYTVRGRGRSSIWLSPMMPAGPGLGQVRVRAGAYFESPPWAGGGQAFGSSSAFPMPLAEEVGSEDQRGHEPALLWMPVLQAVVLLAMPQCWPQGSNLFTNQTHEVPQTTA